LPKPWKAEEDSGNCPEGLPWPGLDENADISVLSIEKVKKKTTAAADQRNLISKAFIADMAAEVENNQWESVRKLAQSPDVSVRTVYTALMRTAKLSKKSARWVKQAVFLGDEEGAFQDV
jgi:hypothetical protein